MSYKGTRRTIQPRYSVAGVTDGSGTGGLPANQALDVYANFNQAFEVPWFGRQQVGAYAFLKGLSNIFPNQRRHTDPGFRYR